MVFVAYKPNSTSMMQPLETPEQLGQSKKDEEEALNELAELVVDVFLKCHSQEQLPTAGSRIHGK